MPTVRIGPDYDNLQPYTINDDANPLLVDSPHWTGLVTFRLNYARASGPNAAKKSQTAYFNGRKRYFSIQTQGRFKATNTSVADGIWTGDDVLFVAETERKIRPPMGAWLAIRFAKFVDPGFTADGMYLERRPWAGSWMLCGMNVVNVTKAPQGSEEITGDNTHRKRINEKLDADNVKTNSCEDNGTTAMSSSQSTSDPSSPLTPLGPWQYHGSNYLPELSTPLFKDPSAQALTASQRRKYFYNPSNRRAVQFHPQNVYSFDFFNDFTNLATMRAEMGVRFDIRGVLDQQPLRFVCTSKDRSLVFFVLEIDYADLQR